MNNFRVPGEFEPQSSVLTTWPIDKWATPTMDVDRVSTEIVSAIISEVEVIISSYDDDVENRAKESLQKAGINIEMETTKRNPGKTKEQIESEFRRLFSIQKVIWIPDENGNFTAYRCASANGHIDEICRFVDGNTILVAAVTDEEASRSILHKIEKERLDAVFSVVSNEVNLKGEKFNVLKMPVPEPIYIDLNEDDKAFKLTWDDGGCATECLEDGSKYPKPPIHVLPAQSYCNFLICNRVVVAQKYFRDGMSPLVKEKDEEALRVLQEAFPNHKIIQIETLALNIYGGGIHCHTRNVPR
ncbi:hypothetical protein M9Y10_026005 [Tritrichomonas musculus]|uniref:Porphyromonas-type peptidyl-arginine deiminase family protein n=1 Tax=Tritrichomonas musculus TaxID=1915356 RepID=A0ABR2H862_9EUKA